MKPKFGRLPRKFKKQLKKELGIPQKMTSKMRVIRSENVWTSRSNISVKLKRHRP